MKPKYCARLDLGVVLLRVEVEQEVEDVRQRDEVAERHPAEEKHRRRADEPRNRRLARLLERGGEERPQLPDQDWQRERRRCVERDRERGHERLAGAERDELEAGRERLSRSFSSSQSRCQ